jgi:hypothetical protein
MKTKLTKEQWLQIGIQAGWTKTAQTTWSGNDPFFDGPGSTPTGTEDTKTIIDPNPTPADNPTDNQTFQTRKIPTLLEIGEPILPAEYSKLFNAVNSHDYTQVKDYLAKMTPDERKKLVQKLANTCKASILIMHECSILGDTVSTSTKGSRSPRIQPRYRRTPTLGENTLTGTEW